ncbi:pseudouridine synthase [Parvularcula sp. IMCC14364]|uniref:pseudouridine synthase n=1 Tax=Parvularcula sp. IMCC14364 TaxID=3067902 RepID=UPI0027429040|nr:pseudouridine synthase [Parvularcula sp. IMCC14364]
MQRATAPSFTYVPPHPPWFSVLHADSHVLVLDKPSGLLSVPGKAPEHKDCLETRVQAWFPEARTVHRLDMDTSGVCVMGLTADAHRNLSMQFQRRKTAKTYLARVQGRLPAPEGEIDLPLLCDWPNRPRQMVDHANGRAALTRWQVLAEEAETSRVLLFPVTGRSHQLRVHMQSQGCPILGDRFYAPPSVEKAASRLQLHAHQLTFHHPADGGRVTFTSPVPF